MAPAMAGEQSEGIPIISNLEIPETVKAGETFTVSFDYEDSDINIVTLVVVFDWSTGQETHQFPLTKCIEKNGKFNGKLKTGPKTGPIRITIYVLDAKKNKSNELSREIKRI
jgi:hypothetical protein